MLFHKFLFPFISTINDRNEPFPTDILEPAPPNIYPKSGTFYDFTIDTISRVPSLFLQSCQTYLHCKHHRSGSWRRVRLPLGGGCSGVCQQGRFVSKADAVD